AELEVVLAAVDRQAVGTFVDGIEVLGDARRAGTGKIRDADVGNSLFVVGQQPVVVSRYPHVDTEVAELEALIRGQGNRIGADPARSACCPRRGPCGRYWGGDRFHLGEKGWWA